MSRESGSVPMQDPVAYFLTWTTHGSWLPGNERGWVEKPGQFRTPDTVREQAAQRRMVEPEITLTPEQRTIVTQTIADHCGVRQWFLHAVNCRTQHVHVVVTARNRAPNEVMEEFKAWCTRRLKAHLALKGEAATQELAAPIAPGTREKWWTQGGSRRRLYDELSLAAAIAYVLEGQGH